MFGSIFGRAQLFADRVRMYVNWVQFGMIAYTAIILTDISVASFLYLIPAFVLLMVFDWYVVMPQNAAVNMRKNPEWQELMRKQDALEKKIDKISEEANLSEIRQR